MKTKWIIPIIALALGCNRETDTNTAFIDGAFSLYASSEENDTRTVLQHDGRVFWSPADYINVFYGDRAGKFKSTNTESAASSEFVGSLGTFILDGETEFVAIYPYADDNSISGGTLNLSLPSEQTAVEGTFADDLFICVAKSKDYNLHFFNVCGGVKFSLARGDIKKIVFRSNHGESLAGNMAVDFSSDGIPKVISIKNGSSMVSLVAPDNGTFTADSFYYLVLAPQVLEGGYTLELYTDELVKTISSNSPITIRRSAWGVLRHLADVTLDEYEAIDLATPLCLEAIEDGTITVDNPLGLTIEYKKGPSEWIETGSNLIWISISAGEKVYFRGDNAAYSDNDNEDYTHFNCSAKAYIYGNIMSLLHSVNFENYQTLTKNHTFTRLFFENTNLCNHPDRPLVMPALTLTESCYESIFAGCTGLTSAPMLPAKTLASSCYSGMFRECSGLTSAPELPAMTLASSCYSGMFRECSGLTSAPELPAMTLASSCYSGMFRECSGLTSAPELPATTLASSCYSGMFRECSGLTSAPELPASTLAYRCYNGMFEYCSGLTTAPGLPATTLETGCYREMFRGCESLTTAPELPATILASDCYSGMFSGCKSLTTAPGLPATTLAEFCYDSMFENTGLAIAPELPATMLVSDCYSGMFSGCKGLTTAPGLPATTLEMGCYREMFRGCEGLTTAPELPATMLASDCYSGMFSGCKGLTTAPELPASTLADWCYCDMFEDCNNLNYIKMLAKDISARNALKDWVNCVASTGIFVKDFDATWDVGGDNGVVPQGWTVETVFTRDQIHVTSVSLNKSSLPLSVGDCEKLIATVTPADADIRDIIWSSSDASVASIDQDGNVQALKNGFASIEVRTVDGNMSAICQITVGVPIIGVSLNKTSLSFTSIGATEKLEPVFNPTNASDKSVTWSSLNAEIATVDADGLVTAIAGGSTRVIVTTEDGGKTAQCEVHVNVPTSIVLSGSSITVKRGSSVQLTASVSPSSVSDYPVTWSSSNPSYVAVDQNGNVTGMQKDKTATITATAGSVSASCFVRVEAPDLVSFSFSPSSLSLYPGDRATVTAIPNPSDATINSSYWHIDYEKPAVVSGNDLMGDVLALEPGNTQIQVTLNGITHYCTVTVLDPSPLAVDLGLSVKWASENLYAESASDSGRYFFISDAVSYNGGSRDVAQYATDGKWRLPTRAEMQELIDNCTTQSDIENGCRGIRFISKKNEASVFFPNVGGFMDGTFYDAYSMGCYYWTNTKDTSNSDGSYYRLFWLTTDLVPSVVSGGNANYRFVIRPVRE